MTKRRKVLDGTENATATNRGIRTKNHCGANYKQTEKGIAYFYLEGRVDSHAIHTLALQVQILYLRGIFE